ncbi:MAG TPA: RHS repeat-associated core domain-containing protein [Verrucomicrobiae bacterium]|nr:RHS repeat-associated core domain-containing protein [Verrucomicrobiae bacterium]
MWGGRGPWDSQYYVWLGDIPVATVLEWYEVNQDTGDLEASAPGIFYIHTDHLGTPRRLSDYQDATNTLVWRWDSDPFGVGAENGDPNGTGVYYIFDLRFPGQVYDAETGKHYNYARDYDPATGRYVESDPIRLQGGTNMYAYVNGNPISNTDPLGLWSVSVGAYAGIGTEITIGNDNGHWFFTDRFGFGIGGGLSWDPDGGVPGGPDATGCHGGAVLSASVKADVGFGPFGAGVEGGAYRNYQSQISNWFGGPGKGLSSDTGGLHAGISVGGQITLYRGIH